MTNCPSTPSATQALLERIAFIQHTHYGGFWDFTSSSTPTDTAYTNQPLAVHTDTTYLTTSCGLQMFHLLSHAEGSGGESTFVDGFAAAAYLRDSKPNLFAILARQNILYHASGNIQVGELDNGATTSNGAPVLRGAKSRNFKIYDRGFFRRKGEVFDSRQVPLQIRWNNDDRDAQTWRSLNSIERWYDAAGEWTKVLKMKQFEIKVQLRPGQPIIFDNWRYLHGRTGFSGKRRICGGYSRSCSFHLSQLHSVQLSLSLRFTIWHHEPAAVLLSSSFDYNGRH